MEEIALPIEESKQSSMPFVGIGIAVLVVLIAGALIWSKKSPADTAATAQTGSAMQNVAGASDSAVTNSAAVKTFTVEAGSFYYKPNEIKVKKGDKVKIVMHSVSMMHDFNIDELNVKMPITKNGDTGTVEFTADKTGTFEYYCSVGQHRAHGQVGKLIVE